MKILYYSGGKGFGGVLQQVSEHARLRKILLIIVQVVYRQFLKLRRVSVILDNSSYFNFIRHHNYCRLQRKYTRFLTTTHALRMMLFMKNQNSTSPLPFPELGPETVLNLVEEALGVPCSNLCRQLNSYINRVFELETLDRKGLIVKFYRPERWSKIALQDEHDFLFELHEQEIPVIPPLQLVNGHTIGDYKDLFFSIFPYCGGRSSDEFTEDQWLEVGRLLGRCHAVGAVHPSRERMVLAPKHSTRQQVDFILKSGVSRDKSASH